MRFNTFSVCLSYYSMSRECVSLGQICYHHLYFVNGWSCLKTACLWERRSKVKTVRMFDQSIRRQTDCLTFFVMLQPSFQWYSQSQQGKILFFAILQQFLLSLFNTQSCSCLCIKCSSRTFHLLIDICLRIVTYLPSLWWLWSIVPCWIGRVLYVGGNSMINILYQVLEFLSN